MGHIERTVFISYRRSNVPWALCIFQNLKHEGFDVFFDYLSINSGVFEFTIIEQIKARAHFLVILTPSALERCSEPNDWLRREIETAIDEKRNIVPLMLDGFDFNSAVVMKALTGRLAALKQYSGLTVNAEYFDAAMDKLRNRFLNIQLDNVPLFPLSIGALDAADAQRTTASQALPVAEDQLTAQKWFELGFRSTDKKEKIQFYSESIRLSPDFPDAYYQRGIYRQEQGDIAGSISDYDRAILLRPEYAEAYNNRGNAFLSNMDFGNAITDYTRSIEFKNPQLHLPYINRARVRKLLRDFAGAIADYDAAIRLRPDLLDLYFSRGNVYRIIGDLSNSVADFNEVLRRKPNDVAARTALMGVLRKLGQTREADEHERFVRDSIGNEPKYNQACFEALNGNSAKALELLALALPKSASLVLYARDDPDLENVREDPRFRALVFPE